MRVDIKVFGSLFLICVCNNMHDIVLGIVEQGYVSTCHKTENRCSLVAVVIKIEQH